MMPKTSDDAVRNLYRRHYASYIRGRRINLLTLEAEAWFWRLHDNADDFGNLEGDPLLCYARSVGGRRNTVTPEMVEGWIEDMVSVGLILRYEADAGIFLHFLGFTKLQPGGKNGRRVRQFPAPPFSEFEIDVSSLPTTNTNSKGIPVNPGVSSPLPCPISHVPLPITQEPCPTSQPTAEDGGNGEDRVTSFFRDRQDVLWSPVAESKFRQLVGSAGWDQAMVCVNEATSRGVTEPFSYALRVWSGEQAKQTLAQGRQQTPRERKQAEIEDVIESFGKDGE